MMNRKIISEACTENSPLKVFGSTNCVPGWASSARISIAIRPPAMKKKKVVQMYWMPDDLVVGVDAEVVLPRVGAVAGVVLRDRRGARGPAEPVVEAADPDQEAERGRDQRADGDDRVPVEQRVPAVQRADGDDDAHAEAEADRHAERGAVPAGCEKTTGEGHFCAFRRYSTRASSSSGESLSPKSWGMMSG